MRDVRTVAVLGAGTMGHGIAQVAAMAGMAVRLQDVDDDAVRRGVERVRSNLRKAQELGKIDEAGARATLERIEPAVDIGGAVAGADLIIEAVPESLEIKRGVFEDVARHVADEALVATNTSSMSITDLASSVPHPGRFIGLHFFNPVHIMKLVEVVSGEETAEETREAAVTFVERIGKQAVLVNDAPGFASSRLGIALGLEAIRMVEQGVASPEDIDTAMKLGYRHPMGPLELTDLVGLDVRLGIAEYLHEELGSETFRPPELLRSMVAQGKLGKKSGRGFYDWSE